MSSQSQNTFRFPGTSNLFHVENADYKRHSNRGKTNISSQKTSNMTSSFLSQKSSHSQEMQQDSCENMSSLHAKLHHEADKIRKWKIQADLELRDKDKKLKEATVQIEKMKRSLLELQLDNEKTSGKLQEELTNREEIIRRMNTTREMCLLLKSHTSQMEQHISKSETEKTELKYMGKETMRHVEELTCKFKSLQLTSIENTRKILMKVNKDKNYQEEKEKELKTQMDENKDEIKKLRDEVESQGTEIINLQALLQKKENDIQDVTSSLEECLKQLNHVSDQLCNKEEELKSSHCRIMSLQDEGEKLEKAVKSLEQNLVTLQESKDAMALGMTQLKTELEEKLYQVSQEFHSSERQLLEEREKLQNCQVRIEEMGTVMDSLKTARDNLMLEKTDAEMNLETQTFHVNTMMKEKQVDKEEIHRLNGEIAILTKKLDRENLLQLQAQDENDSLQVKIAVMELERSELKDQNKDLQMELTSNKEKLSSVESLLSEQESKTIRLQDQVDHLQPKLDSLSDESADKSERITLLERELEVQQKRITEKTEEIQYLREDFKEVNKANNVLNGSLKESVTEAEDFRSKLEDKEIEIERLINRLDGLIEEQKETGKSLTSENQKVSDMEKQNRVLKQEIRSLTSKVADQEKLAKDKTEELSELTHHLDSEKCFRLQKEGCLNTLKQEMKNLKEVCEKDKKQAKQELEKAMEMQRVAEREREKAVAISDHQLATMMATLDSYKESNDKSLKAKEATIQAIQLKLDASEKLIKQRDEDLAKCQKDKDESMVQVEAMESQNENFEIQIKEKDNLIENLNVKLTELEAEIKNLQMATDQNTLSDAVNYASPKKVLSQQSTPVVSVAPQPKTMTPARTTLTPALTSIPATPKTPIDHVTQSTRTPLNLAPKTPQRSILRTCNSSIKRRKVAFHENNDSSSEESDLMELDIDNSQKAKCLTPVLRRASPHTPTARCRLRTTPTPSKIPLQLSQKTPNKPEMLKQLSTPKPDEKTTIGATTVKSKVEDKPKTPNVRKAPNKFFTSTRDRGAVNRATKLKEKPQTKRDSLDWLDMDNAYSFEAED